MPWAKVVTVTISVTSNAKMGEKGYESKDWLLDRSLGVVQNKKKSRFNQCCVPPRCYYTDILYWIEL